jgi:tetratricopeptide (TPR) repeat protein
MSTATMNSTGWLHGRSSDLLFGCGGAYLLLLLALMAFGEPIRISQPSILFPLLTLMIGGPHYGATLLRVYEQRRDRRAYAVFSIWASLAIAAAFAGGLWLPMLGTALVTLYLTWSPWHYTGQNYGIAVMFLRRRGVALRTSDKRWLYASFILSYVFVVLTMHTATGSSLDLPVYSASEIVRFQSISIPTRVTNWAIPMAGLAYLAALVVSAIRLTRVAALRDLLPSALLSLSQVLWFLLPLGIRWSGWQPGVEAFHGAQRGHYFMWIAVAHSAQYLWVTSYYAKHSSGWNGQGRWYAKVTIAGGAIWMLPAVAFGPLGLGPLSMDQGLAVLIAAAVNIHHFVLDGAIWKLRGRIAEVLIRSGRDESEQAVRHPRLARIGWALCSFGLFTQVFQIGMSQLSSHATSLEEVKKAYDRLAWFGLDSTEGRLRLGNTFLKRGQAADAAKEFRRSLELTPLPAGWANLGYAHLDNGDSALAVEAFRQAQKAAPDRAQFHHGEARAWLQLDDLQSALAAIQRAAELEPENDEILRARKRIRAAAR